MKKQIVARLGLDYVEPYSKFDWPYIPYVEKSSHPGFQAGCRFDYGFLKVALREGYEVTILQAEGRKPKARMKPRP